MKRHPAGRLAAGLLTALALGSTALAHPPAEKAAAAPPTKTANLQGNEAQAWIDDPHIHRFYETAVAAYAQGPDKLDFPAFEQKSYAIFRAFGASRGGSGEAMQDHLKLIPRQVVQIVKEDPKVLDSYENFCLALFGPP